MSAAVPGHDQIILTAPDAARLCSSRGCAGAGTLAGVVVTFGILSDPGESLYSREALWKEAWHQPYPMCGACWESCRQVAARYRPRLAVIDATRAPAAPQPSRGRA